MPKALRPWATLRLLKRAPWGIVVEEMVDPLLKKQIKKLFKQKMAKGPLVLLLEEVLAERVAFSKSKG